MNVIIVNKYKEALSNLNIDIIKKMEGEFDAETITQTFSNFYFNRMIIDLSALRNHFDISTIQKLSANLDASKIIFFLDDDPRINNAYLSKIISLGIYNFTRELSGITYLMENPNSYRDVAQYHDLALEDEKALNPVRTKQPSRNFEPAPPVPSTPKTQFIEVGPSYNQDSYSSYEINRTHYVIGFRDLTPDAGATTLIYMLKKQLANRLKVLALEINNNDFSFFKDSELLSTSSQQFATIKNRFTNYDVVLIDLNNSGPDIENSCTDIIYLLEPSTIKLNALIRRDRQALLKIKNEKIVLNKSLLNVSDVKEFEYEAGVNLFYNIPPLDERKDSQMVLDSFLSKMGISNQVSSNQSGGLFANIFRRN